MDYSLTEQQELLKNAARDFLEKECPKTLVREVEKDEKGYSPELWSKMADLGWMGLIFPEEYGGSGLSFLDFTTLLEEMGRAIVPGPFISSVVSGGLTLQKYGTNQQKSEFLPKIIEGKLIFTFAVMEANGSYSASDIEMSTTLQGENYVLNGTKFFVPYGHVADYYLVVARTKESRNKENGITLFLVDTKSTGIKSKLLNTFTGDKQAVVIFEKVKVPKSNCIGKLDKGWRIVDDIILQSAFALCPWMVGSAQQVLEMTTNYALERVQFGRQIGSFQAIQHKLADMATNIAGARDLTYQTAWKLSESLPGSKDISMTKAWLSDIYRKACVEGTQIHGAIGLTQDHDMQLYYRRAKGMEMLFGDTDYHLERVAREMGL